MVEGTLEITISNQIVLATSISIAGTGGANTISTLAGTLQLIETVLPSDTTDKSVTWSILSGSQYVSINGSGLVTALEDGSATIRAITIDGSNISSTFVVIVTNQTIYVSDIIVTGADGETIIPEGDTTLQMSAVVSPPNADDSTFTWSVVNGTGTASIDVNGLLTKITEGTVTVIATANDSKGNYGQQVITLYVTDAPIVPDGSIAPVGWHIPSPAEWDELRDYLDPDGDALLNDAGKAMKETGTTHWNDNLGTNLSGFNGTGSGERNSTTGLFSGLKQNARFWSNARPGNTYILDSGSDILSYAYNNELRYGLSIRCLMDDPSGWIYGDTVIDIDGNVYNTIKIGIQVWMASTLKVTKFNDGTPIPEVTGNAEWIALTTPGRCWYNNTPPA